MKRGKSLSSGWSSGLPPDLIRDISQNLSTVLDFVRFRAVCKSWRSSVQPADVPPQLPWLMLSYDPDTDIRPFYSTDTGTVHSLRLPEFRGKRICGGSVDGWLVLFHERNNLIFVSLLQPLTGSHISLPRLRSLEGRVKMDAARFSGSPTSASGGCMTLLVLLRWCSVKVLVHCQRGPDGGWSRWSTINTTLPWYINDVAICQYSRKVYVVDRMRLRVHDDMSRVTRFIAMPPSVDNMQTFLVESSSSSSSGEEGLLLVGMFWCTQDGGSRVEVYRLLDKSGGEEARWMKIEDISDRLFILCHNQSLAISANDIRSPGCRRQGGNAYMTVGRSTYCLDDGRVCKLQLDLEAERSHGLPLWFVPRLCP